MYIGTKVYTNIGTQVNRYKITIVHRYKVHKYIGKNVHS
jgi:hypothetical protein